MASNPKKVERRLIRLTAKYTKAGGSPRQLRRKAEVKNKRAVQAQLQKTEAILKEQVQSPVNNEVVVDGSNVVIETT